MVAALDASTPGIYPPSVFRCSAATSMGAPDYELRNCVRRGEMAKIKELIKNGADYTVSGETLRAWTPLHIACWGSQKPQVSFLRQFVEQGDVAR